MAGKQLCVLTLVLGLGHFASGEDLSPNQVPPIRQAPQILNGKDRNIGRYIPNIEFQDVAGSGRRLSEFADRKGVVIATTSTSCPLSKKYLPTLIQLAKKYRHAGVTFLFLDPIATDKPAAIQEVVAELGEDGIYVHDRQGSMSRELGLTSTTDVLLLDAARTVRFQGAVDDQYGFGYALEAARKKYLVPAIDEFLKGQPVVITATDAPGCHLAMETASMPSTSITYHNRISRIVQSRCGECHREGGVGPFSLETHADLLAHAKMIETVVAGGTMPPWFAAPLNGEKSSPWINDCSLTNSDKQDLLAWLKSDRAVGDPKDAPLAIEYPSGWTIGKPDLVLGFPEPIPIKATGVMKYKNVDVETELSEDKWVRAIEIRPGVPEVVHHVLVFARPPRDESKEKRDSDGDEISYWGIYVPGNSKQVYPEGFARRLPKGSRIRFQLHYTPSGKETEDQTQVGFVFADQEPQYEVKTASLVNAWFEIPPGAPDYQDSAKAKLPSDVTVLGFLPHMHLRGKSCRYEVVSPDGKREILLEIPRYDFNWQLLYRYAEPRTFSKGTTLKFVASFDNSDKNPANPDPTETVHWGVQTYDEMIVGYVEYYVPIRKPGATTPEGEQTSFGLAGGQNEMLFTALDENDDGKLSIDEFRKLSENPRLKRVDPLMISVFFVALDQNQDGFLSLEEFKKFRELFRKKNSDARGGS